MTHAIAAVELVRRARFVPSNLQNPRVIETERFSCIPRGRIAHSSIMRISVLNKSVRGVRIIGFDSSPRQAFPPVRISITLIAARTISTSHPFLSLLIGFREGIRRREQRRIPTSDAAFFRSFPNRYARLIATYFSVRSDETTWPR